MQKERMITVLIAIFVCLMSAVSGMAQESKQMKRGAPLQPQDARSEAGRINPEEHHLEIVNLNAPSHLEAGRRLDVSITAVDARGIGFVEIQFRDEVRRLEAGEQQIANFAISFETRRTGFDQIRTG
jgi:hypothetical protein